MVGTLQPVGKSPISSKQSSKVKSTTHHYFVLSYVSLYAYTLWWTNSSQWKMAIEIVDFPIKNGDFPLLC